MVAFLYISPEFPPNYGQFVLRLHEQGVNVWAIGEADFFSMPEPVRSAIRYYARTDLKSFPAVRAALSELQGAQAAAGVPPGFDIVESHNETWLPLEARINETCGIDGIRPPDLDRLQKKSGMKVRFQEAGLPVARGEKVQDAAHALRLADALGYPLILKPDVGVGAAGIWKVADEAELTRCLDQLAGDYVLEEFVDRRIVTYDGLVDRDGRVLFESSLTYGDGVLDCVLGKDTFFYLNRTIPEKLARVGRRLVEAFEIRRKFFHFEFFDMDGDHMPIEINCRPPGGPILDMMNYSVDDDLYAAYARMIAHGRASVASVKKYHCAYIGRRGRNYLASHQDILERFGDRLAEHGENPIVYQGAMGTHRYIIRDPSKDLLLEMASEILAALD
ncbi:MAG: hypothetical protein PVG78_08185 [Desulfobacterales bacterium]|jgi:biotin carboxylase